MLYNHPVAGEKPTYSSARAHESQTPRLFPTPNPPVFKEESFLSWLVLSQSSSRNPTPANTCSSLNGRHATGNWPPPLAAAYNPPGSSVMGCQGMGCSRGSCKGSTCEFREFNVGKEQHCRSEAWDILLLVFFFRRLQYVPSYQSHRGSDDAVDL